MTLNDLEAQKYVHILGGIMSGIQIVTNTAPRYQKTIYTHRASLLRCAAATFDRS